MNSTVALWKNELVYNIFATYVDFVAYSAPSFWESTAMEFYNFRSLYFSSSVWRKPENRFKKKLQNNPIAWFTNTLFPTGALEVFIFQAIVISKLLAKYERVLSQDKTQSTQRSKFPEHCKNWCHQLIPYFPENET